VQAHLSAILGKPSEFHAQFPSQPSEFTIWQIHTLNNTSWIRKSSTKKKEPTCALCILTIANGISENSRSAGPVVFRARPPRHHACAPGCNPITAAQT
jgi:hypothetical protein